MCKPSMKKCLTKNLVYAFWWQDYMEPIIATDLILQKNLFSMCSVSVFCVFTSIKRVGNWITFMRTQIFLCTRGCFLWPVSHSLHNQIIIWFINTRPCFYILKPSFFHILCVFLFLKTLSKHNSHQPTTTQTCLRILLTMYLTDSLNKTANTTNLTVLEIHCFQLCIHLFLCWRSGK